MSSILEVEVQKAFLYRLISYPSPASTTSYLGHSMLLQFGGEMIPDDEEEIEPTKSTSSSKLPEVVVTAPINNEKKNREGNSNTRLSRRGMEIWV